MVVVLTGGWAASTMRRVGVLQGVREVKHAGFVARKRARRAYRRHKFALATKAFGRVGTVRSFTYRPERYGGEFILLEAPPPTSPPRFPRQAFVLWTGDNPLTPNRRRSSEVIARRVDLPVHLVTPDSLGQWLVPGHPLHPAYENLSLVHRSDYLRGYLMHHHGGAYLDLKEPLESWAAPYDDMAADPDRWVTSYRTTDANWIGKVKGRLGRDILVHYPLMFGKSGFMMRSHTPLTTAWLAEMDRRLDRAADALADHPGDARGANAGYPLSWTDLLGRVLDPLTLKYSSHVGYDDRLLLRFERYQ